MLTEDEAIKENKIEDFKDKLRFTQDEIRYKILEADPVELDIANRLSSYGISVKEFENMKNSLNIGEIRFYVIKTLLEKENERRKEYKERCQKMVKRST